MPAMEPESEMDDPNMHAYGDQYPDDSDYPMPMPPEGHPLRKLGQRLTELLEEHQWEECERLLLDGWEHDRIDRKTGAAWRQNSSLEIWFPFTAEELGRWKRAAEANIGENVRLRAELDELRHNAGGNATERSEGRVDHNVGGHFTENKHEDGKGQHGRHGNGD